MLRCLKTLLPLTLLLLNALVPLSGQVETGEGESLPKASQQFQTRLAALHEELERARVERETLLSQLLMASLLIASFASLLLLVLYRQKSSANRKLRELNEQLVEQATATEAANKELERLNREMNQMLSFVSHDLKSPLAGVEGLAREIADELEARGEPGAARMSEMIEESARRMFQMVENLLDIQRIESGHHSLSLVPCNLLDTAQLVIEELEFLARRKKQTLVLEPMADTWVQGDPQALARVLTNLVSNAIKYSPPCAHITVQPENGPLPGLSVCDDGPGISKEEEERLFSKFARLSSRPTGGESSTGLGLAISRSLLESMGGSIWYRKLPDRGSCFGFNLPPAESSPAASESTPAAGLAGPPTGI